MKKGPQMLRLRAFLFDWRWRGMFLQIRRFFVAPLFPGFPWERMAGNAQRFLCISLSSSLASVSESNGLEIAPLKPYWRWLAMTGSLE